MDLQNMKSEPVVPRKRALAVRDFPPGCGTNIANRKPLKILKKIDSDLGKGTSHGNDKFVETNKFKPSVVTKPAGKVKYWDPTCMKAGDHQNQHVENCRLKSVDVKGLGLGLGRKKPCFASRSTCQVKFWDPTCEAERSEGATTSIGSSKEDVRREKIKEAMAEFDKVYEPLFQENKSKPKGEKIPAWRVPLEVAKMVKWKLRWMDPEKKLGHVCGVQIGDKFKYRAQLMMIGLHCQHQSGIDYANIGGKNLATSIVDAHRYSNESGSSDTLVYSGQGGLGSFGSKLPPEDQKLERGNLALKNSMDKKTPVRVIRKVEGYGKDVFVYDGLYIVSQCINEKSEEGKIVFKFHLNRVPGQPSLRSMLKW